MATLLTNAVPIAAGTIVLDEPVPAGAFGRLRLLAFAAVVVGAILLTRSDDPAPGRATGADVDDEHEPEQELDCDSGCDKAERARQDERDAEQKQEAVVIGAASAPARPLR